MLEININIEDQLKYLIKRKGYDMVSINIVDKNSKHKAHTYEDDKFATLFDGPPCPGGIVFELYDKCFSNGCFNHIDDINFYDLALSYVRDFDNYKPNVKTYVVSFYIRDGKTNYQICRFNSEIDINNKNQIDKKIKATKWKLAEFGYVIEELKKNRE